MTTMRKAGLSFIVAMTVSVVLTAKGQTLTPGDPAIFNIAPPPVLPDPGIVCAYASFDAPDVIAAVRLGDYYTAHTIGTPFLTATDYPTAVALELVYLGYLQRRMNFISSCLKLQNQSVAFSSTLEPNTNTPPHETTGNVESDWSTPDDDQETNANLNKFFALPQEATPAVTQAQFIDFLQNRIEEDLGHYQTTYSYLVHVTFLENNQGGGLKNPKF